MLLNNNIHTCAEVLTVINRAERARAIVIVKHNYMLMCNHKIRLNIMHSNNRIDVAIIHNVWSKIISVVLGKNCY